VRGRVDMFFSKTPTPIQPNVTSAIKLIYNTFIDTFSADLFLKLPFFNFDESKIFKMTITDFLNFLKFLEYISENKFSFYDDGDEVIITNFFNTEKNKYLQYVFYRTNLLNSENELKFIENNVSETGKIILPSPKVLRSKKRFLEFKINFNPEYYFPRIEYRKYQSKKIPYYTVELYLIFAGILPDIIANTKEIPKIPEIDKYFKVINVENRNFYVPAARLIMYDIYTDYPYIDFLPKPEHYDVPLFKGSYTDLKKEVIWDILDIRIPAQDVFDSSPTLEIVLSSTPYIYKYQYTPFNNPKEPKNTELRIVW
jgi:hypothetical protein